MRLSKAIETIDIKHRSVANACWDKLQDLRVFRERFSGVHSIDSIDICKATDVVEYFSGNLSRFPQLQQLPEMLQNVDMCCVFKIDNEDRSELAHLPTHVRGWTGTFIFDMEHAELVYSIIGTYST